MDLNDSFGTKAGSAPRRFRYGFELQPEFTPKKNAEPLQVVRGHLAANSAGGAMVFGPHELMWKVKHESKAHAIKLNCVRPLTRVCEQACSRKQRLFLIRMAQRAVFSTDGHASIGWLMGLIPFSESRGFGRACDRADRIAGPRQGGPGPGNEAGFRFGIGFRR